jgi:hypothetical protein
MASCYVTPNMPFTFSVSIGSKVGDAIFVSGENAAMTVNNKPLKERIDEVRRQQEAMRAQETQRISAASGLMQRSKQAASVITISQTWASYFAW